MDSFEKAIKVLRDKSASEDAKDLAEAVIRDVARKPTIVGPQIPAHPLAPYIPNVRKIPYLPESPYKKYAVSN